MNENNRTPNFFWPVILIGVGVIILIANLGLIDIEVFGLWNLARLWPLLLVAIGVNLLFGKNTSWAASAFSLLLGLVVVAAIVFAPSMMEPLPGLEVITESFSEPVAGAESAQVRIDFDKGGLEVSSLEDRDMLFAAQVTHNGRVEFNAAGDLRRNITLNLDSRSRVWDFDFLNSKREGLVGLNPDLPIDLFVKIGSGNSQLDLAGLNLSGLDAESGSGTIELLLPAGPVPTKVETGSGSLDIQTAEGTELDLVAEVGSGKILLTLADEVIGYADLQSGSGRITVFVPRDLAVQLVGSTGSGRVDVPSDFDRVSGSKNQSGSGDSGIWQSPGYDDAEEQLVIEFSLGSGVITVQYY